MSRPLRWLRAQATSAPSSRSALLPSGPGAIAGRKRSLRDGFAPNQEKWRCLTFIKSALVISKRAFLLAASPAMLCCTSAGFGSSPCKVVLRVHFPGIHPGQIASVELRDATGGAVVASGPCSPWATSAPDTPITCSPVSKQEDPRSAEDAVMYIQVINSGGFDGRMNADLLIEGQIHHFADVLPTSKTTTTSGCTHWFGDVTIDEIRSP